MGKYDKVIVGLPKEIRHEGSFREKVDAFKKQFDAETSATLAEAYGQLRDEKADLEVKEKELNVRIAGVEEMLWNAFEDEGVTSLTLRSGHKVRIQPEPIASVKDKDALRKWVVDNGLERLMSLSWQTTTAIAKERLLNGDGPPDGVELKVRTRTVFSKG